MTSPMPPGGWEQLSFQVAHALPFDDQLFPRLTAAGAVVTAYQGGGLTSAAERAYLGGYRSGERDGQLATSRAAYQMFDEKWFWEPEGTKRQWLADCLRHADDWAFEARQRFYASRNPDVDAAAGRRALQLQPLPVPAHQALPHVAAKAYQLGAEAGRGHADQVTAQGIVGYARERAAELGLDPALVDVELDLTPARRPQTQATPHGLPQTPNAVAGLSFAAGATPSAPRHQPPGLPATKPGRGRGNQR